MAGVTGKGTPVSRNLIRQEQGKSDQLYSQRGYIEVPSLSALPQITDLDSVFTGEDKERRKGKKVFLKITRHFPRRMDQEKLADLQIRIGMCKHQLKANLKEKNQCFYEEHAEKRIPTCLDDIYTELYITAEGCKEGNYEHEARPLECTLTRQETRNKPGITIPCTHLFKPATGRDQPNRTVMTEGVSGIGKTVSVRKFVLDWAEDKANWDIDFMFPFTFQQLNLLKKKKYSLVSLIHDFFSETEEAKIHRFENFKVLFIFDGLDQYQLPLDFKSEIVTDVTEMTSVNVLLVNLIRGQLLPSAQIWITTQPAAAGLIPLEFIDLMRKVRGFTDPQKELYFRNRFRQETTASRIISHIETSQTLSIMCHIPFFCNTAATVFEDILTNQENQELPSTVALTVFYISFLLAQSRLVNFRYSVPKSDHPVWNNKTKTMILSLGKLAFEQLKKGNLIFYEEDLREYDIDIKEASVYSGVLTQVSVDTGRRLCQGKLFSFIHLSIQEFLAALYVFLTFHNSDVNLLSETKTPSLRIGKPRHKPAAKNLYQCAVNKALQCPDGHLDLFLRFLLGLSLEANQTLLEGLLKPKGSRSTNIQETVKYIKEKIEENPAAEKSMNLFYCLNEMNDHSLVEEIQKYLSSESLPTDQLSPGQWSALVFTLLSLGKQINVFELKKYSASEEGLLRLLPVVKASSVSLLNGCQLTQRSCRALASVLRSRSCLLRELDLSNNNLEDSGVRLLSGVLGSPHCELETLRLQDCNLSQRSCEALASVLSFGSCPLRELDLSNNSLEDSGVKQLSVGLGCRHCNLQTLRLSGCLVTEDGCAALASALRSNPSHLKELDLSCNHLGDSGVKLLEALLEDPRCRLETLRVDHGGEKRLTSGQRMWPSGKLKLEALAGAMESGDWTKLDPAVNTVDEVQTYSLQSDAGCFECCVSALRWVCQEKVSFKYQFCSWEEHMEMAACMDYMPAGPLLDIRVTAGKLEEVHLPHWICIDHNSNISDMFAVLHVDTCGNVVERVSEVTSSHVKLFQPVFSPRGATIRKRLGLPVKVFYDVLIYKTIKAALTLHVYLVPPDPALKQAVEREEKSDGSKRIPKPNPDKSLQLENHFFLSTDSDTAEICPDKLKLTCERRTPNFFEVFIRNVKRDFSLKLEGEQKRSKEKDTVWTCTIRTDDYQNKNIHHEQGQHFVDRHHIALINRVKDTAAILDELKDEGLISSEAYDAVRALKTTQAQMRDILRFVTAAGRRGKDALYEILTGLKHLRPLLSDLEGSH